MKKLMYFIFAVMGLFSFHGCAKETADQDESPSDTSVKLTQVKRVLEAQPENLVNYTWKVLYSVNDKGIPCTNDRCFRAEDLFFVLHNDDVGQQCDTRFSLLMHDVSADTIRPFPTMNGKLYGCKKPRPDSVRFYFLDEGDTGKLCREMIIEPIRIYGMSNDPAQCFGKLKTLSKITDDENVRRAFGGTCEQKNAVHWQIKDADQSQCSGLVDLGDLAPPEPGQGTASGTQ